MEEHPDFSETTLQASTRVDASGSEVADSTSTVLGSWEGSDGAHMASPSDFLTLFGCSIVDRDILLADESTKASLATTGCSTAEAEVDAIRDASVFKFFIFDLLILTHESPGKEVTHARARHATGRLV